MKAIKVLDADYKTLMSLSKELQLQPNHHQAFPYYWEPRSDRRKYDLNGEGEFKVVADTDGVGYDPVELAGDAERFGMFLSEQVEEDEFIGAAKNGECLIEKYQEEWILWLCDSEGYTLYTYNMEPEIDHNPSLFLDDVKDYIKHNQHHLGPNAHTYGNTIQRMSRMERLVEALYRLNPQSEDDMCDEAWVMAAGNGVQDEPSSDWSPDSWVKGAQAFCCVYVIVDLFFWCLS